MVFPRCSGALVTRPLESKSCCCRKGRSLFSKARRDVKVSARGRYDRGADRAHRLPGPAKKCGALDRIGPGVLERGWGEVHDAAAELNAERAMRPGELDAEPRLKGVLDLVLCLLAWS